MKLRKKNKNKTHTKNAQWEIANSDLFVEPGGFLCLGGFAAPNEGRKHCRRSFGVPGVCFSGAYGSCVQATMDGVCAEQVAVTEAFATRSLKLTFFGVALDMSAKSSRSEVHIKLAALLKEQSLGKRQGVQAFEWETLLMADVINFEERMRRTVDVGAEHLQTFVKARAMASQMLVEGKAVTLEQIFSVWTNKLQMLLEVDGTFELEMGLLNFMIKQGSQELLAQKILGFMPDEVRAITLDESIAGLQTFSAAPFAVLLPEQSKGALKVALQILTSMKASMTVDIDTLSQQPYMGEFCERFPRDKRIIFPWNQDSP